MISTAEFRNGIVIKQDNDLYELVEFQHVKPGKGGAFVRTRLKNVMTGRVIDKTFRSGEKMEDARLEEQHWQYLYNDGDLYYFMHPQTFEQIEVGQNVVGDSKNWLKENDNAILLFYEGRVMKVGVPISVVLKITECEPGVQGDRAQGGTKPATLETGATIQVPLFVNEGDSIKVDTRTGQYQERAN
jgi:elongation factor P